MGKALERFDETTGTTKLRGSHQLGRLDGHDTGDTLLRAVFVVRRHAGRRLQALTKGLWRLSSPNGPASSWFVARYA